MMGEPGASSQPQGGAHSPPSGLQPFVIKNPARAGHESFTVQMSMDDSVARVKQRLEQQYPGSPAPASQTVRKGNWGVWGQPRPTS